MSVRENSLVERLRAAGCVYAEDEAALLEEAATGDALEALALRRIHGEPLEVVLGWAEFRGLRIFVDAGVFVPRKRTEVLVELGLPLARAGTRILDLCCGTGAVGAAMLAERPGVTVWGAELDPAAAACARRNLPAVFEGDLFAPLPHGVRFDLLLVNAPYVPSEAIALMPPEARLYEPRIALDGGDDGLDLHRRVASEARDWLTTGGTVIIETSEDQAERTAAAFAAQGFSTRIEHSEELDGTAVVATAS